MNKQILVLVLLSTLLPKLCLGQIQISDFKGDYGSIYFHGSICKWEKCEFPELYQAHHLSVSANTEKKELELQFLTPSKTEPVRAKITVPIQALKYYKQEGFGIDHEGYEMNPKAVDEALVKEEKTAEGETSKTIRMTVVEIRLAHWLNDKATAEFRSGVELILGSALIKRTFSPDGALLSEAVLSPANQEVSNQYIRDLVAEAPSF